MSIGTTNSVTPTVTSTVAAGLSGPIGWILDGALDGVEKTLNGITDKIHDATADIIRQAADQAFQVIASLKGAYADSLELTYEKADKLMQQNIDRVMDLVKTVTTGTADAMMKVADKIEDIIKLSPLSNWWLPLLSQTTPRFFAVDANADRQVLITFKGNFAYADRPDCVPRFTLNKTTYNPSSNSTKELQFLVTVSSKEPNLSMHGYSYLNGSLKVTWKSGYIWGWTTSDYRVLLGMLPATPGKVQVVYTKAQSTKTQNFVSGVVDVKPTKNHWTTDTTSVSAHSGWHVVGGTPRIVWTEGPRGQCNADITASANPDVVSCKYSRKEGQGSFQIVFTESQVVPKEVRLEAHDDLRWGSTFVATPRDGEEITQINFDAFNGQHIEFQPRTDETSSQFIKLRKLDGTIQVAAIKAADVNIDMVSLRAKKPEFKDSKDVKESKQESKQETKASSSTTTTTVVV